MVVEVNNPRFFHINLVQCEVLNPSCWNFIYRGFFHIKIIKVFARSVKHLKRGNRNEDLGGRLRFRAPSKKVGAISNHFRLPIYQSQFHDCWACSLWSGTAPEKYIVGRNSYYASSPKSRYTIADFWQGCYRENYLNIVVSIQIQLVISFCVVLRCFWAQ